MEASWQSHTSSPSRCYRSWSSCQTWRSHFFLKKHLLNSIQIDSDIQAPWQPHTSSPYRCYRSWSSCQTWHSQFFWKKKSFRLYKSILTYKHLGNLIHHLHTVVIDLGALAKLGILNFFEKKTLLDYTNHFWHTSTLAISYIISISLLCILELLATLEFLK